MFPARFGFHAYLCTKLHECRPNIPPLDRELLLQAFPGAARPQTLDQK
jgi:hypothetical protein